MLLLEILRNIMKILSNFDVFSFYCILYFNYFKTFSYAPFKLKCNTIYNLKKNQHVNIPFDRAIAFVDNIMHGEFVACHKM